MRLVSDSVKVPLNQAMQCTRSPSPHCLVAGQAGEQARRFRVELYTNELAALLHCGSQRNRRELVRLVAMR